MGSTAGWQRSIALLFGEASSRRYVASNSLSDVPRRARGGLCNCRHVAECSWDCGRANSPAMTSRHCQPISRADGGDGGRQVISVKAGGIGIEHSPMKAPLLALSHSGRRPTRPYPVREQRSSYPFRAKAKWPRLGTIGNDNFSARTDPASSSVVRFAA